MQRIGIINYLNSHMMDWCRDSGKTSSLKTFYFYWNYIFFISYISLWQIWFNLISMSDLINKLNLELLLLFWRELIERHNNFIKMSSIYIHHKIYYKIIYKMNEKSLKRKSVETVSWKNWPTQLHIFRLLINSIVW